MRRNSGESKESIDESSNYFFDELTELNDPVLLTPYKDFLLGSDGFLYERSTAEKLRVSPITREPLSFTDLNTQAPHDIFVMLVKKLKRIIDECKQKTQEWQSTQKYTEEKLAECKTALASTEQEIIKVKTETSIVINDLKQEIERLKLSHPKEQHESKKESHSSSLGDEKFIHDLYPSYINKRFLEGVKELNLDQINYYIKQGANVDATDLRGDTALILAVRLRENYPIIAREIIEMLCSDYGAKVNVRGFKGMTALHRAAGNNDVWACKFLLEKGAIPSITNDLNETPRKVGQLLNSNNFNNHINTLLAAKENALKTKINWAKLFNDHPTEKIISNNTSRSNALR